MKKTTIFLLAALSFGLALGQGSVALTSGVGYGTAGIAMEFPSDLGSYEVGIGWLYSNGWGGFSLVAGQKVFWGGSKSGVFLATRLAALQFNLGTMWCTGSGICQSEVVTANGLLFVASLGNRFGFGSSFFDLEGGLAFGSVSAGGQTASYTGPAFGMKLGLTF